MFFILGLLASFLPLLPKNENPYLKSDGIGFAEYIIEPLLYV